MLAPRTFARRRPTRRGSVRGFTDIDGLMSYAPGIAEDYRSEGYRCVGIVIGKILKGDKPAELPFEQVTKIKFIINLRTAKALGLAFPLPLAGRVNEVIE